MLYFIEIFFMCRTFYCNTIVLFIYLLLFVIVM